MKTYYVERLCSCLTHVSSTFWRKANPHTVLQVFYLLTVEYPTVDNDNIIHLSHSKPSDVA